MAAARVVDLKPAAGATQRTLAGATNVVAIDGSRAYATCGTGKICAYNAGTGALQWTIGDGSAFAAEAGGVLYLAAGKALNSSTGTLIKQIVTRSGGAGALVVGDGRIGAALSPTRLSLYGLAGP
jgi:outer membrane protein assembly factor BamB